MSSNARLSTVAASASDARLMMLSGSTDAASASATYSASHGAFLFLLFVFLFFAACFVDPCFAANGKDGAKGSWTAFFTLFFSDAVAVLLSSTTAAALFAAVLAAFTAFLKATAAAAAAVAGPQASAALCCSAGVRMRAGAPCSAFCAGALRSPATVDSVLAAASLRRFCCCSFLACLNVSP